MKYIKKYEDVQLEKLLDQVFQDCDIFINDLKKCKIGSFLTRGIWEKRIRGNNYENFDIQEFDLDLRNRQPENTPNIVHDKLNELFNKKFGWNVRNGAFCFGNQTTRQNYKHPFDTEYGSNTYLLFPIGEYQFVWNEEIKDLFYEIDFVDEKHIEKSEENLQEIVDTYSDENLCNAIESKNEICIESNSYYLINQKYIIELIERIWINEKL